MNHIAERPDESRTTWDYWDFYVDRLNLIHEEFPLSQANNPAIMDFYSITYHREPLHVATFEVNNKRSSFQLCVVEYEYQWHRPSRYSTLPQQEVHIHLFGYIDLNRDYGVALIRPETFKDKINELIQPIELDMPSHPKFSENYFVHAHDKEQFTPLLTSELMDLMQSLKGLQLEFKNKRCIFRLPKPIDVEEGKRLCEIGLQLNSILNNGR